MLSPSPPHVVAAAAAECRRTLQLSSCAIAHCSTMPTSSTARKPKEGCCWPRARLHTRAAQPASLGSAATVSRGAAWWALQEANTPTRRRAQSADFLTLRSPHFYLQNSVKTHSLLKKSPAAPKGPAAHWLGPEPDPILVAHPRQVSRPVPTPGRRRSAVSLTDHRSQKRICVAIYFLLLNLDV